MGIKRVRRLEPVRSVVSSLMFVIALLSWGLAGVTNAARTTGEPSGASTRQHPLDSHSIKPFYVGPPPVSFDEAWTECVNANAELAPEYPNLHFYCEAVQTQTNFGWVQNGPLCGPPVYPTDAEWCFWNYFGSSPQAQAKNLGPDCVCDGGAGGGGAGSLLVGDPINVTTGDKYDEEIDYAGNKWLTFRRFYNSLPGVAPSSMGTNWRHSFDRSLVATGSPATSLAVVRPNGRQEVFIKGGSGWTTDPDVMDTLTEFDDSQGNPIRYTLYIAALRNNESYSAQGQLQSVQDENGLVTSFTYSTSTTDPSLAPTAGLLLTVTDPKGRHLQFAYNSSSQLRQVTLPDGGVIAYSHDTSGNLATVQFADSAKRQYVYNEASQTAGVNMPNAMTGIVDEAGARYESTYYQVQTVGMANESNLAGNVNMTYINYNYNSNGDSMVQNASGVNTLMSTSAVNNSYHLAGVSSYCGPQCHQPWRAINFDSNGFPSSFTDFDGNVTNTTYTNGLLTQKIEGQGGTGQRTTNTAWDPTLRVPQSRTVLDASGATISNTQWVYNASGQVLARCEIDPTNSAANGYLCSNTGTTPAGVRRWTNTYCSAVDGTQCPLVGLLLTSTGPRTDVTQTTTYSYYLSSSAVGCGTPGAACHQAGDLHTVTDPLGHVTTIASYDASGRITRTTDSNGINTDLIYNTRGWLASRSVGGAVTTITYMPYGSVHTIVDPDGVRTTYDYDAAHRLVRITDAEGNYIQYTLDAAGNRKAEQVFDASGALHRSLSRTFNSASEVTTIIDGLNQTVFNASASGSYDGNGNLKASTDGLNIAHQLGYDALNRLVQTIDDYNGTDAAKNTTATYTYDSGDRLSQVTDPNGLTTTFGYDGLGDAISRTSPDSGSGHRTFDAAGNVLTLTDAKGITATYTYDALNRVRTVSYPDTTQHITYHYDEANSATGCASGYPRGHLSRIFENGLTTVFCYDARGNVITKRQLLGTTTITTDTTTYTWTAAGRLSSVTYPDGTQVAYTRDNDDRIATVTLTPSGGATFTAVSGVAYLPFGPLAHYTLGNGQLVTRTYDANYRLTDLTSAAFTLHLKRDVMGDVVAVGNAPGANPATESYSYDPLFRLTAMTEATGSTLESVTYNLTGDRLSKTGSGLATGLYTYNANSHQLNAIGNAARTVDANGNTTALTMAGETFGFTYNNRDRLAVAQRNGATAGRYVYNALGERVQKTVGTTVERFSYDEQGVLLGEYGAVARDYVWLDGVPVANVDIVSGTATVSYVVSDHIGTPRAIADGVGNTIWQLPYQGNAWSEQAPVSNGYVYNLRFPGQYFDAETGFTHNFFRDFDPSTGRYLQSDPAGLAGGLNTYAYVYGDPLMYSDPRGQCPWCVGAVIGAIAGGIAGAETGGWKGALIGAGVGAVVGAAAPWLALGAGDIAEGLIGSEALGDAVTTATFSGTNAVGAGAGTMLTNAVEGDPLWKDVGKASAIGAAASLPEGMAVAAGIDEASLATQAAFSSFTGLTTVAVTTTEFYPLPPGQLPVPPTFSTATTLDPICF
jgi:RHS repeat-associated protein